MVFNQKIIQPQGGEIMIRKLVNDILQSSEMYGRLVKHPSTMNSDKTIFWRPSDTGYVKINYDGAACSTSGKAACGGVIRDHHSNVSLLRSQHWGLF